MAQRTAPAATSGAERLHASHASNAGHRTAVPAPAGLTRGSSANLGLDLRIPQITFRRPLPAEQMLEGQGGRRSTTPGSLHLPLVIPGGVHGSSIGLASEAAGNRRLTTGNLPVSPFQGIPSLPQQHHVWDQQHAQQHAQHQAQQARQRTVSHACKGLGAAGAWRHSLECLS